MKTKPTKSAAPTKKAAPSAAEAPALTGANLLPELRELIQTTRRSVAVAVNAALTALYWQIGARIRREILGNERAEYGQQIVATLGRQLAQEFGQGFGQGTSSA